MKFQTILLTFFGIMAIVGLIAFSQSSTKKSSNDPKLVGAAGNVEIWGTFPENEKLGKMIKSVNDKYKADFSVTYKYHDPVNFDRDIVEALASDKNPDVLLLPDDLILRHSDKIELINYQLMPSAVFSANFIQAAEIYMRDNGLVALPFAIDPLVMYWNRDLFNNASITQPPQFWDEFLTMTPKLTKRNAKTSDLMQSAVPFGEYVNVTHAKDIITMLFLQVGNPIVKVEGGVPVTKVGIRDGTNIVPDQNIVSAFRFYMDFSNPIKSIYTWSRARSNSQNEFIKGDLAVYFDYASAHNSLLKKNPNLNFAVAQVPQPRGTTAQTTFAKVHGLSVLKRSKNKTTAFIAVQQLLMDPSFSKDFAAAFDLPPVRRDLLGVKPTDAVLSVSYDAAIRARTWLDPDPAASNMAFQNMVESVSSGRKDVSNSVESFNTELTAALVPYKK